LQQKLSPTLINVNTVEASMDDLRQRANLAGFDFPVDDVSWIYQLPGAFLSHPDGRFCVFIHAPMHQKGQGMELFEFMQIPVALENSNHSITIEPEGRYIGVNQDRDGFLILSEDDITKCSLIGEYHICNNFNFQYKKPETFCISSLFWRFTAAAHSTCKTAISPPTFQVLQASMDTFYVFHPTVSALSVKCADRTETYHEWRGSRLIKMHAGCQGYGRGYSIVAHPDYTVSSNVQQSNLTWTIRQLILDVPILQLDLMVPTPPKHKIMVEDLVGQMKMIEVSHERLLGTNYYPLSFASSGVSVIGIMLLITFVLLVCFCCRTRIAHMLLKRSSRRDEEEGEEENSGPIHRSRRRRRRRRTSEEYELVGHEMVLQQHAPSAPAVFVATAQTHAPPPPPPPQMATLPYFPQSVHPVAPAYSPGPGRANFASNQEKKIPHKPPRTFQHELQNYYEEMVRRKSVANPDGYVELSQNSHPTSSGTQTVKM